MRRAGLVSLTVLCLALIGTSSWAASASWVATAPAVRVAPADRETVSALLEPPGGTRPGRIESVAWRFQAAPGRPVLARLCHVSGCVSLPTARGRTQAWVGRPATGPWHFRFSLPPGGSGLTEVGRLQVIVNYREESPDGGGR